MFTLNIEMANDVIIAHIQVMWDTFQVHFFIHTNYHKIGNFVRHMMPTIDSHIFLMSHYRNDHFSFHIIKSN
jgi:hypothetical protein